MTIRNHVTFIVLIVLLLPILTACGKPPGEELVGEWVSIDDPSSRVRIARNEDHFIWEDDEGKYPATYEDGILTIHGGFGEAVAFYDEETGHMILRWWGDEYTYTRTEGTELADTPTQAVQGTPTVVAKVTVPSEQATAAASAASLAIDYLNQFLQTQDPEMLIQAITYGEQAISLTTDNATLRNHLARIYLIAANYAAGQEAVQQQAASWLRNWEEYHLVSGGQGEDTHLTNVATHRQQATELLDEGSLRRALLFLAAAELRYSLFLDGDYPYTYLLIGDLYRQLNMPEAALMYGAGVRLQPDLLSDAQAGARIHFLAEAGWLEPLIQGYQEAAAKAETDQDIADSYQALGYIYAVQGELETAIQYYQSALSHQQTIETHKNLATLYQQTGRIDQAIAHAEAALEMARREGRDQDVQALQAFLDQINQLQEQVRQAEEHAVTNPEDYQAHYDLAGLYIQTGRLEDALRELQLAAQYVPTDQPDEVQKVYTRLGNCALAAGNYEMAEAAFLQVLAVEAQNFNAHYKLAQIYREQGRTEEALNHAEAALQAAPDSIRAEVQSLIDELRIDAIERLGDHPVVHIETARGTIRCVLRPDTAPQTVANFVQLALEGWYDGHVFFRVEPGFVIMGGSPDDTAAGDIGYTIEAEIGLPHVAGTIAMARQPDDVNPEHRSDGSQFYITLAATPHLDGAYTVFGYCEESLDVLQQIQVGDAMIRVWVEAE